MMSFEEAQAYYEVVEHSEAPKHHWSPDWGYFVHFKDKLYQQNGYVREAKRGNWPGRMGMGPTTCPEDYSEWTDEHRAKVRIEHEAQLERNRQWELESDRKRWRLMLQARRKISKEQFHAILSMGRDL